MVKKILIIVGLCLLVAYLIFMVFFFKGKPGEKICSNFSIEAVDSATVRFINVAELQKYVANNHLNPYGKQIKEINTDAIEKVILDNKIIQTAEAFITDDGDVRVKIKAKEPVLRVISDSGANYYLDKDTTVMPVSIHFAAYVPIATGAISEQFAKSSLFCFATFLGKDEFWNAQIEQIQVLPGNEIVLIPRVGNQKILLGKITNFEDKLKRLYVFYQKAQNKVGWNKYRTINLKYGKQVVCSE